LFCKKDSCASISVEHIIPESLGNLSYILPPGVVCDRCNNYFSQQVEKPFLNSPAIVHLRFHQNIVSKRGKVPPVLAILAPNFPAAICRHPKSYSAFSLQIEPEGFKHILDSDGGELVLPFGGQAPSPVILSRFLAKVALEAMAHRLAAYPEGLEYLVDETQLDPIRNHARRGEITTWPVHVRRIYSADQKWIDEQGAAVQIVHEFDILCTPWNEWFLVITFFGLELAMNYGGPEIEGYERWLSENNNVSPLYWGKNAQGFPTRIGF